MKFRCRWWQWFVILTAASSSLMVFAQARPFPGPDVQQIYQRLLPQVEKIPIFDHLILVFPTIPTLTPWPLLPAAPLCVSVTAISN